jgi:hypothetical protein
MDNLVGCNGDRWHAPDLQTSRFEELRKLIMKTSIWYEKAIRRHYPELNIIHLNALQSAPGAEEQNCLHLDYNILTQGKEVSSQPISAIIAIEQFRLDIVTDPSNKKLKTITVEPGDMIVFPNKCIHRGGPNKTNKNQRRIFLYIASDEADIDNDSVTLCEWNPTNKCYEVGHDANPKRQKK